MLQQMECIEIEPRHPYNSTVVLALTLQLRTKLYIHLGLAVSSVSSIGRFSGCDQV